MTGLDDEPSPEAPWTHSRRGAAHRWRRPGKEERRRLMFPAIPVSSHGRTVPGPASLGSDSTATSVPMTDGSNAEGRHHRSRWTTTTEMVEDHSRFYFALPLLHLHHPVSRSLYHGGGRPSSEDSLHSPTVIPLSALDKPSIMKRCHRRRTCSHTSPRRSPTMISLHDTGFVECRWWNDGWTVKTVVT